MQSRNSSTKFLVAEDARLKSGGTRCNIYLAENNLMVVILSGNKALKVIATLLLLVFIYGGGLIGGAIGGLLSFYIEEKISGGIDRRKLIGLRDWSIDEVATLDGVACPMGDVSFNEIKKGVELDLVSRKITIQQEVAQQIFDAIHHHKTRLYNESK